MHAPSPSPRRRRGGSNLHRRDGRLIVSATDLVGFLACGHLTQLDRAAAAGLIHKPDRSEDPEVELLQRRGGEHEQRYVAHLRDDGRTITDLSAHKDLPYAEQAALTVAAMERGDDVIFQATVFDGRWVGHPDFLLRVPAANEESPSVLSPFAASEDLISRRDSGAESVATISSASATAASPTTGLGTDWIYEVADTKLAHSAKASALIQICSYVDQIERIQGVRPERVYVVTGGAEIAKHAFRTAEMMAYYRRAKARFEEALDEAKVGERTWPIPRDESYPDPVEHCGVCRWYPDYCRVQWRDDDALKLVAGISRDQRKVLTTHTVTTMRGLSELTQPLELDLKRGQNDSMWRMREQARLQVETGENKVPVFELLEPEQDAEGKLVADRGLSALPKPDRGDLFFDIEGDPFADWVGLEYLFGIWEGGSGEGLWDQGSYRGFWGLDREDEKRQFEHVMDLFIERWKQFPDMHIYHYAPYEPTALKRLAGRHATREEELDQLLRGRVFVDLYRVVRQGVRVGAEKYSIKNLEPLYGYNREIDLRSAGESIVEFEFWLDTFRREGRSDQALLNRIELYNRDDCISTERLRDWLEERRADAAATWGELPRPPTEVQPTSDELTARQAEVRALEEKLTAGVKTDPNDPSDPGSATWLVAHLLDWHRRENKASWWRFYELLSMSDEELFDAADAIGWLTFAESWEVGGRSRSNVYRYTFPRQEFKVDVGHEAHDPQLVGDETSTGEVVAIDKDAGTVDIRRLKTWTGQHPRSIVPLNIYRAPEQQKALMRFGEWVAANGVESESVEWRAARDLLLRLRPRVGQSVGQSLKSEGEPGDEAARRLSTSLAGTTLAIQGPPGSGKTYTGARMIVELVSVGRRVGITSNGHKVISNLLEAICEAARGESRIVRIIQKGEGDEVLDDPFVKGTGSNSEVAEALATGTADIAAGTPWLWSRPEMAGLIETLFVDEAGQVSLANVVAMSGTARNVVLLGDPQQLEQPIQGAHPLGAERSALGHFLGSDETVPDDRGIFFEHTRRMHPAITEYTSELFYESKLNSIDGLERQEVLGDGEFVGSGLRWVPVNHTGNTNESVEEADRVAEIWKGLVGLHWIDADGARFPIGSDDIVIVSPFNAHRVLIQERLPDARVGTVDKFQGQEAAVSIYTMATSRPEDAPRGLGFLYSLNRLNVATSRARALAIVVCSSALLAAVPHSPEQLRMVNGLCAFVESATVD